MPHFFFSFRQIVTNHLLHFLALDRSDPKKFQVLQLIAALLAWTDDEREQAGLANPKSASGTATPSALSTSFNSLRIRDMSQGYKRSPSTPNIAGNEFGESPITAGGAGKESLAELWSDFLQREAEEGERGGGSRKAGGHSRRASTATNRSRRESQGLGIDSPSASRERSSKN
jgi:hypothetical protein